MDYNSRPDTTYSHSDPTQHPEGHGPMPSSGPQNTRTLEYHREDKELVQCSMTRTETTQFLLIFILFLYLYYNNSWWLPILKKNIWQTVIWHETSQLRPAYLFLKLTNEKKCQHPHWQRVKHQWQAALGEQCVSRVSGSLTFTVTV